MLFRSAKEQLRHLVLYDLYHSDESIEARINRLFRGVKDTDALGRSSDHDDLGYMIRILRTKMGLTQEEFAKRVNVHQSYISKIEHAKKIPTEKMHALFLALEKEPLIRH